jgi:hypothetical protein
LPKKVAELWGQLKPGRRKALLVEAAAAKTDEEAVRIIDRGAKDTLGDLHHIGTDKNWRSTLRGGPWSQRFKDLFAKVGLSLDDPANKVRIPGHAGPHPEEYHEEVYNRLANSIVDKSDSKARKAFLEELEIIADEAQSPGTKLHRLLTK